MKLQNSTLYNYRATIDNKEYELKGNSSIEFDCAQNTKVELINLNKSSVHMDWIQIILLQMLFGSTTLTKIYTNYSFVINDTSVDTINLEYNNWSPREQIDIKSCYAHTNVGDELYSLPQLDKVKNKHKRLHLFVSNAFPIGILTLVLCFFTDPAYLFLLLFALWLIVFEIPSLKEIKRFKELMKPSYLNEKLCEYANRRRTEAITFTEDTSKTGKYIKKIIGKMFRFDEEK
nr:hypothetical protein [Eubacteriales bacterium]